MIPHIHENEKGDFCFFQSFAMNQDIKKRRWFYLVLFCLINLFAGSYYAWSVLAPAIAQRLTL